MISKIFLRDKPLQSESSVGSAAASDPNAEARPAKRLNRAKRAVLEEADEYCVRSDCSRGKKILTSPPEGLIVPKIATSISGQNSWHPTIPIPVKNIKKLAPNKRLLVGKRWAMKPIDRVMRPEPRRVAVNNSPIFVAEKPSKFR